MAGAVCDTAGKKEGDGVDINVRCLFIRNRGDDATAISLADLPYDEI